MNDIIELKNVGVTYPNGHIALKNVSGHLHSGTICGLVGINGAGKSTLFNTIMGFIKPTTGQIKIMGQEVRAALKKILYLMYHKQKRWTGIFLYWLKM